jgi:transcriptional regulator with XRE-family HTH domain
MTGSRHERLNVAMEERRLELGLSWKQVAGAADISEATLRAIRNGANEPSALTARGIERALGWAAGGVERVLNGGRPGIAHTASARLSPTDAAREAFLARPVPTDEELRASALKPETVEALLAMRERFARWAAEGDEDQIRRAGRLTEALDEERDAG